MPTTRNNWPLLEKKERIKRKSAIRRGCDNQIIKAWHGSWHGSVAESEPAQKELMIRLILNLLEDGGG
jgi:hypothetical protein